MQKILERYVEQTGVDAAAAQEISDWMVGAVGMQPIDIGLSKLAAVRGVQMLAQHGTDDDEANIGFTRDALAPFPWVEFVVREGLTHERIVVDRASMKACLAFIA